MHLGIYPHVQILHLLLTYHIVEVQYVIVVHLFTYSLFFDDTETRGVLVIADAPGPEKIFFSVHLYLFKNKALSAVFARISDLSAFSFAHVNFYVYLNTYRDHLSLPLLR